MGGKQNGLDGRAREPESSLLLFFSKNPWLGVIASLSSVLGLILTVYFYFLSIREPDLTFVVQPGRFEIVNTQPSSSRIAIKYQGHPVSGVITSARVAFWNAGKEPIERSDIRIPLVIATSSHTSILSATVKPFVDHRSPHFTMSKQQFAQGLIGIEWDVLENGEGAFVDFIYNGSPDVKISMHGKIKRQKSITSYQNRIGYASPLEEYEAVRRSHRNARLLSPILALTASVALVISLIRLPSQEAGLQRKAHLGLCASLVIIIFAFVVMYWLSADPVPPMSF